MRKFYLIMGCIVIAASTTLFILNKTHSPKDTRELAKENEEGENHEEYDGPEERAQLEFEKTKDPSLGYVPYDRLMQAIDYTENLKQAANNSRGSGILSPISWQERGPIYDSVGPSNGNTRGGNGYTSGRMAAVLIDTLNDPTGNTAFCGGIAGGLWKCTNFLSTIPNWQVINDRFNNLAVSSICQDPSNPSIMYFSTGEATSNADAVLGAGIWKSTNAGTTWTQLPSSVNLIRSFKILCDAFGNVYLAARTTAAPASNLAGLLRSTNGGTTWTNIAPTLVGTATATATCTDIEISSTGKLYASFGYLGTIVRPYVANDPATVTQASGWTLGTGIRTSAVAAIRLELACIADTVYGITSNTAYIADSCYKSIDGGQTWTKQNTAIMPAGIGNGQAWYDLTLAVNPSNSAVLLAGGLDAYRSVDTGKTWTRLTFWVTSSPYVHADHHYIQWWNSGGQSRIVIGCDGGIFYSANGGTTWVDKNRNLGLKQFYAGGIHPGFGSPYLLAGAQDNGCHSLKNPGLSYSTEVTGGDGCFVHVNQQDPNIQFGSYVYNQYRRSTNGGASWSSINPSTGAQGMFVNPFDYDDYNNVMYACWATDIMMRWPNANIATATNTLALTGFGSPSCFKVSASVPNRVFIGSNNGKIYRLDNAQVATPATFGTDLKVLTGASFPAGFLNCINTGSTDDYLVACFTNYGINNVWYSSNGGTSWTAIDGNLPDMPVRWAIIDPAHNDQVILATEAGIYQTDLVNGASTVWVPNTSFPTVRTDMLQLRISDNTIVAATHGRGLFTGVLPTTPEVRFLSYYKNVTEATTGSDVCRRYKDYTVDVSMVSPVTGDATVTYNVQAGGTAANGIDFDFTTNGDFNNPSKQHVFPNGFSGTKTITIRVYDDTEAETIESFTIGYTISGSTNAIPSIAGYLNKFTLNIQDNNDGPPAVFTNNFYTIGTFNTNVNAQSPFASNRIKHRMQALYYASELQAAGIYAGTNITAMNLNVVTKNSTKPYTGFTIQLANTTTTTLSAGFTAGTFTQVYTGDYSSVAGTNTFNFSTPFAWDGASNVVVQICFDNGTATADAAADLVEGNSVPLGTGIRGTTYSNYTTGITAGCSLAAAFVSDVRMNASFKAALGSPIATVLNATGTEYHGPNRDIYYYTSAREILGRIVNLSNHDYKCTQFLIDRAGTGSSQFWNTDTSNYLMNKTFRIIPTTNNPTGKYEVTFYFTKEEKEGWERATGQSWANIQIIKLPSQIKNVTPLNMQPDGPGTVQVVNPVQRTFGTGYTLSYIFDNGFGGFGFGVAGRMNENLVLTGHIAANNADIDLNWTTAVEINSTNFEVEKSNDGTNFRRIGVVPTSIFKLTPSSYGFTDHENMQYNYYRIRMLHSDGFILYSNTVYIKKDDAPQHLFIYPNPFVANLSIRFGRTPTTLVTFSLYDMAGKLVKKYSEPAGAVSYTINTSGIVSKGIYLLKVDVDGKTITERVMK
jgi:photosystem II stability/assembly factor-like uncharacterized protein